MPREAERRHADGELAVGPYAGKISPSTCKTDGHADLLRERIDGATGALCLLAPSKACGPAA